MSSQSLAQSLKEHTSAGELCRALGKKWLKCLACGHECRIPPGKPGICKVRFNDEGQLRVPYGYVAALACDPIEKKPFFHALPGTQALSFGMLGCDLHCAYCQNWVTSQALRDPEAIAPARLVSATQLVQQAESLSASTLASTYNEPLITAEWGVAVFRQARAQGLRTAFISNGNATPEVLDYLQPWVDLYKVDLKSFSDKAYRRLGGRLSPITRSIEDLYRRGFWLEIVTLVVPGFNDDATELRDLARFIASVSPEIPWHVTAFHRDYKMTKNDDTPAAQLVEICEMGASEGLAFVYAGNLPGRVGPWENTYCPDCRAMLVERHGFRIVRNSLQDGCCFSCQRRIPGVWS